MTDQQQQHGAAADLLLHAISEQPPLLIHASPSSETDTVAFSSTLATLPCSLTVRNSTTATVTATRPATIRFPDVSVLSFLLRFLSFYVYFNE